MERSSSKSMDFYQMGLKVLTICRHGRDQNHHNSCIMTSSMLSPTSSSSSSVIGDYIGTESCFDVLPDYENDVVFAETNRFSRSRLRGRKESKAAAAREFPPPIPLLARTENLPSHMPWVLKRVYTSDGRLILREEKVRHHEYFRAHRSNGRLTLQLVPLDDDVFRLPLGGTPYDDDDGKIVAHDDNHDHDDHHVDDDDFSDYADEVSTVHDTHCRNVRKQRNHDDDDHDHDDRVQVDDDVLDHENGNVHEEQDEGSHDQGGGEEAGAGEIAVGKNTGINGGDDHQRMILSTMADQTLVESGIGSGGSPVGKCLKSCFLGMQVPEIRPVVI